MFAGFSIPELRAAWSLGNSADSRDLIGNDRPVAREALPPLTFCISREAGAIANTLGVSDGIVLTAGIVEHQPQIREAVRLHGAWFGVAIDQRANSGSATRIEAPDVNAAVPVIPIDKEHVIAKETQPVLRAATAR